MRRTQDEYKSLENKPKKDAEKHILEINNIYLKRLETEEKYGHVKETELYKEKEKVFLETFDALTRLKKIIKKNSDSNRKDPVIDITGEEILGGTSSNIFACDKCDYKSSISENLSNHKKNEHTVNDIPCELCEFVGKNSKEYQRHFEMQKEKRQRKTRTMIKQKTWEKGRRQARRHLTKLRSPVIFVNTHQFLQKTSYNTL